MAAKKANAAAELLLKRVTHADQRLTSMPSERELALALGISRSTLRMATKQLLDDGVLTRLGNRRLAVADGHRSPAHNRTIGFLTPAAVSLDAELWRQGVQAALEGYPTTFRAMSYAHWADPCISDALRTCDGIFLLRSTEAIPDLVMANIRRSRCRLIVLDQDETAGGLPSVVLFPPAEEVRLLEHLAGHGHKRIDCINTQSSDGVIQDRIETWRQFIEKNGLSGQLRSQPIFEPIEGAYRLVKDLLHEGRPLGTAQFCTTGPAAIGAMRALHEAKLEIGRDVSVCAVNDEGLGRYLLKSLTALESPPRALYLREAVQWMFGDGTWEGPLLVQPKQVNLFVGESTGPAPAGPVVARVP